MSSAFAAKIQYADGAMIHCSVRLYLLVRTVPISVQGHVKSLFKSCGSRWTSKLLWRKAIPQRQPQMVDH